MIKVIAKCDVLDSKRAEFVQNATQLVNKSREEAGCVLYELFHDLENTNIYFFLEEWKSDTHLNYHSESDHFKEFFGKIMTTLNSNPEVNKTQKSI